MYGKITTDISICQAKNGFSLDELVKKLADRAVAKPRLGAVMRGQPMKSAERRQNLTKSLFQNPIFFRSKK